MLYAMRGIEGTIIGYKNTHSLFNTFLLIILPSLLRPSRLNHRSPLRQPPLYLVVYIQLHGIGEESALVT